jgi:hypothetical protein
MIVNGGAILRMAVIMMHHPSSDDRFGGALRPVSDECMTYAPSEVSHWLMGATVFGWWLTPLVKL